MKTILIIITIILMFYIRVDIKEIKEISINNNNYCYKSYSKIKNIE